MFSFLGRNNFDISESRKILLYFCISFGATVLQRQSSGEILLDLGMHSRCGNVNESCQCVKSMNN